MNTKLENPFDLDNSAAYEHWRDHKLKDYPVDVDNLVVETGDPRRLSVSEHKAIQDLCQKTNMAIYAGNTSSDPDKEIPRIFGASFGLTHLDRNMGADDDGITSLQVRDGEWRQTYIPYTNRPIHWHTDGYYNTRAQQIQGLILHCVSTAAQGGENALLDPEIAYIHLRDKNPEYIRALMAANAMIIPANINNGEEIRPARSGPVFSIVNGGVNDAALHMRYTARTRSIEWQEDAVTQAAIQALQDFLASDSAYIFRATLQPGQGLICNNVLHDRSGFEDNARQPRCLYRLRYYQRLSD
ncbi:MAG: TauD/TfdA family dioxygenase [Gammaproteobacteria bacterium]